MPPISVVILTFNAEETIAATVASAKRVSDDIHVIDSFSRDSTLEIVRAQGCEIVQHAFESYGAQRNWGIEHLPLKHEWELHLDADERISSELANEIIALFEAPIPSGLAGYYIPRLVHFQGRPLKHGGLYPNYHLRLFRRGSGRCESRRYDQHFYLIDGDTTRLRGPMIDDIRLDLSTWTDRHNRWADAEVEELLHPGKDGVISAEDKGPVGAKRAQRDSYYRQPMFLRPLLLFAYRYVVRRGFMDGTEGLIFYVLQTFWFRFLIDAKLYERQRSRAAR